MTMGRESVFIRTAPDFDGDERPGEVVLRESYELGAEFGSFACAESTGRSNEINMIAPRKFGTDTRPSRIQ
jgi:hypothetical protein